MLSLDFADTAIIETIATAKTIMAIVPNSGTTCVPIISILVSPSFTGMLIERNSSYVSTFLKSVCIGISEFPSYIKTMKSIS